MAPMSIAGRSHQVREVFVDSSGYLALAGPRDSNHQEARAVWTRLSEERWATFTTNFVVAETHALFLSRLGHHHATVFLRRLATSSTTIVRASSEDEQQARDIIYRYDDHDFSYTDAVSFVVMGRLGIASALAFNRHFTEYGLTLLQA